MRWRHTASLLSVASVALTWQVTWAAAILSRDPTCLCLLWLVSPLLARWRWMHSEITTMMTIDTMQTSTTTPTSWCIPLPSNDNNNICKNWRKFIFVTYTLWRLKHSYEGSFHNRVRKKAQLLLRNRVTLRIIQKCRLTLTAGSNVSPIASNKIT